MSAPLAVLEARSLTLRFGAVAALREVSFSLGGGEIHALCGENGAGKSTLIKTLSGVYAYGKYEGQIFCGGKEMKFTGTADATAAGIAVIHQELALVENLSVAENIFLGREPRRGLWLDRERMLREAGALLSRFEISLSPETMVGELGVGEQQLVEIVRALARESRILILDEPTAALAEGEVRQLLGILRQLRGQGVSCIYISHKLAEVEAVADRITVLRDGATVWTTEARGVSAGEIIKHMVGRELVGQFPPRSAHALGAVMLQVEGLTVGETVDAVPRLRGLEFAVRAGEVLGIGGLMGAGRSELLLHLAGAWGHRVEGHVVVAGEPVAPWTPREAISHGVALVTEDRKRYGLHLGDGVAWNVTLSATELYADGCFTNRSKEMVAAGVWAERLQIKSPSLEEPVSHLSGGNQQKVVMGKVLATRPKILLLDEPTRGIDAGARWEVYEIINGLLAEGMAVVMVSSDLSELMGMSDRIVMLAMGRLSETFSRPFDQERLMAAALER